MSESTSVGRHRRFVVVISLAAWRQGRRSGAYEATINRALGLLPSCQRRSRRRAAESPGRRTPRTSVERSSAGKTVVYFISQGATLRCRKGEDFDTRMIRIWHEMAHPPGQMSGSQSHRDLLMRTCNRAVRHESG